MGRLSLTVRLTGRKDAVLLSPGSVLPDLLVTTGDEQADDPESIARWIAAFDAIPPLEMTAGEEAEWRAAREAQKAFEMAKFEEHGRRIEALFP